MELWEIRSGAVPSAWACSHWAGVFWELRRVRQIKAWPRTVATILDSCVREHDGRDSMAYTILNEAEQLVWLPIQIMVTWDFPATS
jgi:hypothetical protein